MAMMRMDSVMEQDFLSMKLDIDSSPNYGSHHIDQYYWNVHVSFLIVVLSSVDVKPVDFYPSFKIVSRRKNWHVIIADVIHYIITIIMIINGQNEKPFVSNEKILIEKHVR